MKTSIRSRIFASLTAAGLALAVGSAAFAQADSRSQLHDAFDKQIKGKTVAWVPISLGVPIADMWTKAMRENFERWGMKFIVRDPNFNSNAQLQAVTSLVNEKPAVLIVQNQNVTLLSKELKRAMDAGIYVIQVNMASNQQTDGYVGVDWADIGREIATDIVKQCGDGKGSGKVAMIQGEATAAGSVDQLRGAMEVFNANKSIKVVSTQPGNWDAGKANELTATVLQQHPDLCASYGYWGIMQAGAAQAVKAAGKQGKVLVYSSSDGPRPDCDLVEQKLFTKILSYRADVQGEQIANMAALLLQGGEKPGTKHMAIFSNNYWVASKADRNYCFEVPQAEKK